MKKTVLCLLLSSLFIFAGCSSNNSSNDKAKDTNKSTKITESTTNTSNKSDKKDNSSEDSNSSTSTSTQTSSSKTEDTSSTSPQTSNEQSTNNSSASQTDLPNEVTNYILNGQDNKSEAEKYKWSTSFLSQVDITSLYNQYTANGGDVNNVESFAKYITENAPVPANWEDLFKADFAASYGAEITKIEALGNDLYQVYANVDGTEVPYVTVNARTGYYHG